MKVMRDQLREREKMAEKLRKALRKQTEGMRKKELRTHESTLRSQIEQFDKMIQEAQTQLANLDEFERVGVKPKIRSPRKESTGSNCSSTHSLRRLNSSEHSDVSPRRSPANKSAHSPKTTSSISSESLSPNEDESKTSPLTSKIQTNFERSGTRF